MNKYATIRRSLWGAIAVALLVFLAIGNPYERYLYFKLFLINWDKTEGKYQTPGNPVYEQSLKVATALKESRPGVRMALDRIGTHRNHHSGDGAWFYWIIRNSSLPEVNGWLFAGCADSRRTLWFRYECASLLLDKTGNPACYFFLYDIASSSRTNAWHDANGVRFARDHLVGEDFFPWPRSGTYYFPHNVNIPVGATRDEFFQAIHAQIHFTNSISLF